MSSYPQTWTITNLFEVCQPRQWKTISTKELTQAGYTVYGANGVIGFYNQYTHEAPTLMITCRGATCGNLHISKPFSYINGNAMALDHLNESICCMSYLHRFLQARGFDDVISGSAQPQITQEGLRKVDIPIAPRQEQKRIADKLDTVLTRVDAVNTRLARVAPLLKRFRQSVLAAATSGRLTEDWRIANPSINAQSWLDEVSSKSKTSSRRKPLEPSLADLSKTVQLPETWTVTGLDSLAADKPHALKAGPFGSALKKSMYVSRGYKIYGQEQVIAGDETVGEYFIDDEKFAELKACAVESGDILISLVGTIGRVLVLSPDALPGIINPRLVKLSLHPEVNRSYFSLYLRSPIALSFFEGNSHGGTMDILNLGILRNLPLLIPPPAEQTEIVRRVETLFAFADRLEARLAQAQTAATRLTPALLAKAFRGELVPQDPNDEPAAELLRRLASNPTVPPKRGRAAKAT